MRRLLALLGTGPVLRTHRDTLAWSEITRNPRDSLPCVLWVFPLMHAFIHSCMHQPSILHSSFEVCGVHRSVPGAGIGSGVLEQKESTAHLVPVHQGVWKRPRS